MNKIWTEEERDFIRKNADNLKDRELAVELSGFTGRKVTLQAVRKQRQKLDIAKIPGRGKCGVVSNNGTIHEYSTSS